MIRRRRAVVAERSRFCLRDLATETVAGIAQRPGRTVLTMLGTVLGTGAFIAVLGTLLLVDNPQSRRYSYE